MIFDIQRFSTHDGPGIRTVVFFKGCTLSCPWCENPESQSFAPELLYTPARCIDCGSCLDPICGGAMRRDGVGGIEVERGVEPGPLLATVCPALALRLAGREASAPEILAEVLKDEAFFKGSGGGVTFSGGEPLAQVELLDELARGAVERGLDTAIETCLAVPWQAVERLLGSIRHWLVDLKHCDPAAFRAATGGDASQVLGNIERLARSGADLTLRVPVVPGFNDDEASMGAILRFAASLPGAAGARRRLDLLPYHDLAMGKFAALGRSYPYETGLRVEAGRIEAYAQLGRSLGLDISLGG
jgi:pyruvate formate lyase activating enzyme